MSCVQQKSLSNLTGLVQDLLNVLDQRSESCQVLHYYLNVLKVNIHMLYIKLHSVQAFNIKRHIVWWWLQLMCAPNSSSLEVSLRGVENQHYHLIAKTVKVYNTNHVHDKQYVRFRHQASIRRFIQTQPNQNSAFNVPLSTLYQKDFTQKKLCYHELEINRFVTYGWKEVQFSVINNIRLQWNWVKYLKLYHAFKLLIIDINK